MKLKAKDNSDMIIQGLDVCVAEGGEITIDLDDFEVVDGKEKFMMEWARRWEIKPTEEPIGILIEVQNDYDNDGTLSPTTIELVNKYLKDKPTQEPIEMPLLIKSDKPVQPITQEVWNWMQQVTDYLNRS